MEALGKDLVPEELEFVPTTFNSLRDRRTLMLVVAGYLNTREGIYGPFDYRPKPIPNMAWFNDLLTLHGQNASQSLWGRVKIHIIQQRARLTKAIGWPIRS